MAGKWRDVPFAEKLFTNVKEAVLTKASAALENCFINEAGGHSRFPGLTQRIELGGAARVYLSEWQGDLMAESGGRLHRINRSLTAEDITGVPVSGGRRTIFAEGDGELLMAAGGPIVRFAGAQTEVLSADAPEATHVGYLDGYVLANEKDSGRFQHSAANDSKTWDPLDVFAANGNPDNVTSLAVTPYRELLVCGVKSVEQYERLPTGDIPFFRRWAVGEGIFAPYTLVADKDGNWGVNDKYEFVRFTGQTSQSVGDDLGLTFEGVDDWTDAWAVQMNLRGQKFILLQIPRATNVYGTQGITALHDYRQGKWYSLYGWDDALALPARWPGWSYQQIWGRHFVGGEGKIYELDASVFQNAGKVQRMMGRTAHVDSFGEVSIDNVRMRVKRGVVGPNADIPVLSLRCLKDNRTWTRWVRKSLGRSGDTDMFIEFGPMGQCSTMQFEWEITDQCEVEAVKLQVQLSPLGD